ncbi:MAG: DUF805 domain-containing protein, partial [Candidatus Woesebacteria bacterium]|nr:DUF805 domain-containing protein [Candidatus Woesebacteria bacterium]
SIFVLIIMLLPVFMFALSVTTRRFHDLGKSGWNFLWMIVPIVNIIWAIVLLFKPGNNDSNKYGNPPKGGFKFFLNELFLIS